MADILINNDEIVVSNPDAQMLTWANKNLSYTDKSKQYQLRRMAKNMWMRNSPIYAKLQAESKGQLHREDNGNLIIPSTFYHDITSEFKFNSIVDKRKETGAKIVVPWVNKPYDLRDYQEEAVELMLNNFRGIINLATGLGKTLIATHMVKRYKKRTLIVCPTESVAKQFYKQFIECFGKNKVGFYGGGKKRICDITVGIAASITKNIQEFKDAELGLVIFDETHHTPATTFFDISKGLAETGKIFGLTATDYRSDGKDIMITGGCGQVLIRRDIKWGVANGWLAEPVFIVREVPTMGKDHRDDKIKSYKAHVLNEPLMLRQIEHDAQRLMAAGKSVLILVDEVEHGKMLSLALNIPFATGTDAKSQEYVDQLNAGKVKGLVGTDGKIGEGSDTQNVDALILANFVASKGPVIQAVGRGLRKQGSKTHCLVLDYIPMGSTMLSRHGYGRVEFYREITDKVKIIQ